MPLTYGGPYSDDPANPTDSYVVASYPANERTSRTQINALVDEEHDHTNGRHKFTRGTVAQRASFAPVNDGTLFIGSDMISVYDAGASKWLEYGLLRTGDFKMTAYNPSSPPEGFLPCDGASVSRTTYAALFAKIGTAFGSVDGSTFNIPNFSGSVPVGFKTGGDADGDYGTVGGLYGEKKHALTASEMAAHAHTIAHAHTLSVSSTGPGGSANLSQGTTTTGTMSTGGSTVADSGSVGSGTPHENRQPSVVVGFLVKT